jgi:ER lumen protein retaining receptor
MIVYATRYVGTFNSAINPTRRNTFLSTAAYTTILATNRKHPPDLLWTNPTHSLWNTTLKIIFIAAQAYIVYLMLNDYKPTHDPNQDTFKVEYLLGGAAVLAILFPYKYTPSEMLWAFSIWLESVAILPQLFMLQRTGSAETITTHYIFALGAYRALYIPNWIWRCVQVLLCPTQKTIVAE